MKSNLSLLSRLAQGVLCVLTLWKTNVMAIEATQLRCEDRAVAVGVDVLQPRLGWALASEARGQLQTAFRILVASSIERLDTENGDLWDSGKIESDESLNIPYAGRPLETAEQVFWKVRAWDQDDRPSAWSAPATWTMGATDASDWSSAKWIRAFPPTSTPSGSLLLRRAFDVRPGLRRAVVLVSGLGQYEMTLNGVPVTDDVLTPGWSKYDKTVLYDTYDVTALLRPGSNAAGIALGNGMYNVVRTPGRYTKFEKSFGPKMAIAQLRLQYEDGTSEVIGTDDRWRAAAGPITFTSIFGGEDEDARLRQKGWDSPGFDDTNWAAVGIAAGPGGTLRGLSCAAPAVRRIETRQPAAVRMIRPGVAVYDFGQNAAQMPTITVSGADGASVRLRPAELLNADGTVDQRSTGSPIFSVYTLTGGPPERWSPRFFYSGYRYLQVECQPAPNGGDLPVVQMIESSVVHTTSPTVGTFETSSERLNRIYTLVRWAQRSNMVSVLTDCPHREKLGWLEQIHLNGPALRYNFDLNAFFTKTMNDMSDSQLDNGFVPTTAPEYPVFGGNFRDSPEWGSAFLVVAWQQYEFTGDVSLLRRHYDGMRRYVDYLKSRAKDGIVAYGLSDWYDIGPGEPGESKLTPKGVTATAFYYLDTRILAKSAALLGKVEDAKAYEKAAEEIRFAFNKRFFNAKTGQYATGSQCANALPLVLGLAEPKSRDAVLANLVDNVQKNGLTAGDIGYKYLLNALADAGRSDLIFAINDQSEKPGYGMQLARGATSLTEAWDANPKSSQNHFMLGQINEWFFRDLAGIRPDPTATGFKKTLIRPTFIAGLSHVKASYVSARGPISTEWRRAGRTLKLNVSVPANTTAAVTLPTNDAAMVTESGRPATSAGGVLRTTMARGGATFEVGSGTYQFVVEAPQ